ncbi:hypothetical protein DAEQUDRAFT_88826 [Daedalea quercina L-15889]|uniref:Uncharacterized protein n=1 Tax=Daedalea quercina L-15889 TaxID=1314783 RepID=A0A165KYW1_9APHY|nr:hypothetical protein DAEQUDRAFT_88826 [Daedalea quercina L-15889]
MSPSMIFKTANSGATYISLIYGKSDYYASWDPSRPVRLGDYGHLQADYSFAPEGNIFDRGLARLFDITARAAPREEVRCIVSRHVDEVRQSATDEMGVSWLHKVKVGQAFTVNRSYGAILLMLNPRLTSLEPSGTLHDLVYSTAMKKRHLLVSEIYHCPSYARLLAPKQSHTVKLSLEGGIHQGLIQGKEAFQWIHDADGGDFKSGIIEGGDTAFTPLFRLVGRETRHLRKLPILELAPPKWRRVVDASPQNLQLDEGDDYDHDGSESADMAAMGD